MFINTSTIVIYTLSLHDALPISCLGWASWSNFVSDENYEIKGYTSTYFASRMINVEWLQHRAGLNQMFRSSTDLRSEEHTSELQSHSDLVCRLLLEKKKKKIFNK